MNYTPIGAACEAPAAPRSAPKSVIAGVVAKAAGFQPLELELLVLPLRHRGATHSRVIGLCSPAATPNWLGLAPVAPMSVKSMRVLQEGGDRPAAAEPSQLEGLARLLRRGHFRFFSLAEPPS
jgi:hypothetical protein